MIESPTVHPVFEIIQGQIRIWEKEASELTSDPREVDDLSFALEGILFWENQLATLKRKMYN